MSTTQETVSPFLNKDGLTLLLRRYYNSGKYISKKIIPPEYNTVNQTIEFLKNVNSEIYPYFGVEDGLGNIFWTPAVQVSEEVLPEGGGWKRRNYETTLKLTPYDHTRGGWLVSGLIPSILISTPKTLTWTFNTVILPDGTLPVGSTPDITITIPARVDPYTAEEIATLLQTTFTNNNFNYIEVVTVGQQVYVVNRSYNNGGSWTDGTNPDGITNANIYLDESATETIFASGVAYNRCGYASLELVTGGSLVTDNWYAVAITKSTGAAPPNSTNVPELRDVFLVRTGVGTDLTLRVTPSGNLLPEESAFEDQVSTWNVYMANLGSLPPTDYPNYIALEGASFLLQTSVPVATTVVNIASFNPLGAALNTDNDASITAENFRCRIDLVRQNTTEESPKVRSIINVMKEV
jgi:hypothetical protein